MSKRALARAAFAALAVASVSASRGDDDSDLKKLVDPAIFDRRFYAHHNLDLGAAGLSTKEQLENHWKYTGCREGRQASPTFDARTYLATYGDLRAAYGTDTRAACLHYVTWGRGEGRQGVAPDGSPNLLALDDPNVAVFSPANASLGVVRLDVTQPDSPWRINQWATTDYLDPSRPQLPYSDALLGPARACWATGSKRWAIFQDGSRWVHELASAGGVNRASGGSNIFISHDLPGVPVMDDTRVELDWKLLWMRVVKTQPIDGVNVGQCFIGLIVQSPYSPTVIFIQKGIAEANDTKYDAHVDAGTNAPLWSTPLDPDGALFGADATWRHGRIWLRDDVVAAIGATYATPQGPATIADRDPDHWRLTSIYIGLETAGDSAMTIQLRNLELR